MNRFHSLISVPPILAITMPMALVGCPRSGPHAEFTSTTQSGGAPLEVQFVNRSFSVDSSITGWTWRFGDGCEDHAEAPRYRYKDPGVYTVSLTAHTANGPDCRTRLDYVHVGGRRTDACDTPAEAYTVIEYSDNDVESDCICPETCICDYLAFPDLAEAYARPISEGVLSQQLRAAEDGSVALITEAMTSEAFRDAIVDALNIRFLVECINQRPLTVVTSPQPDRADCRETKLVFSDPYVGAFEGILLTPVTDGPFPAVIAVHGHRDNARIYAEKYGGYEYPRRGYAILMLTMRGMAIDIFEHEASKQLLLEGFSLIGIRVYETLLALKYLRFREDIDETRIGLIGHSGGSSTSNLTVRIEHGFAAYVSDLAIDYIDLGTLIEPWHCETLPALYPYNKLISDFSTSPVPVLLVPYGYPDGLNGIFDFFDRWLAR